MELAREDVVGLCSSYRGRFVDGRGECCDGTVIADAGSSRSAEYE